MSPLNRNKTGSFELQHVPDVEPVDSLHTNISRLPVLSDSEVVVVTQNGDSSTHQPTRVTKRQIITVVVLCYANLINYMDRYTTAGTLYDIQRTFQISDSQSGLLQTAFILVYMVTAPIFGFLGDRFSRKYLMAVGIFLWSFATLVGSFMPNYGLFLLFRCLVAVGEANYSTIAPTIISDLFVKDLRSKMLAGFYFAIPVGCGLGYTVGAEVTNLVRGSTGYSEAWRWGMRVTPAMGLVAVFLLLFMLYDPPRGESEGGQHLQPTSFSSDLKYLLTNKSFVLSTLAFTSLTFMVGALAWWGPIFTKLGVMVQSHPNVHPDNVAFVFGAIAMSAGLIGVPLGSFAGQKLRVRIPYADPLVCGVGLLFSVPLLIGAIVWAEVDTIASFVAVFFGQIFLNLNWAVVSDIVLYVVIPTRRSTAEAMQILFSHALGDAGSPYLIGVVADIFKPYVGYPNQTTAITPFSSRTEGSFFNITTDLSSFNASAEVISSSDDIDDLYVEFKSKQYAMFLCAFVNILGAVFFFWNSCYITADKERCDRAIVGEVDDQESTSPNCSLSTPEDPEIEQTQNLLNSV